MGSAVIYCLPGLARGLTAHGAVEQQHPLEEGRVTPQSKLSDSSDNTDSTSKWSELSGFFGHRELLSHLSLAMSQQSLREEELRARHHSALCRLREDALWEKTQAEIAWLEHRRRCLRAGEEGTLADITKKQEEVVNRMQQEQAEIRHWRNLYRSGRQQRKLLLWQQREVTEIRRSAAQLKQELQEQVSEKLGGDRHLESGRKCPTMQRGWASVPLSQPFSKNPLSDREEKSRASIRRHDLLLRGDVFQDSQTAGQDRDRPAAQPGAPVDMKARTKLSEEGSLERKALEDSQRLGCGIWEKSGRNSGAWPQLQSGRPVTGRPASGREPRGSAVSMPGPGFTAKTDAGLGRLLPSEDGWNWRRRRSATDEMAPAERGELRAPQFGYPGSLDGRSKKVPLPPQKSIHAEGRGRDEEEEGETMAMTEAQPQDYPTAFVSEGRPQTLPPPRVEEESGPPERVSQEEELWSDESSSSGGPLRVRSLPNSAEVSWKSQKSVGSFASLPEFQRAAAVCMNVSEMSGPSSDVEEDLPLDVEDGGWRPAGHINEGDREQCTGAPHEPCLAPAVEPKKGIGNMVALNVRNDQRSQSALTSNNNCEIMPSSCATVAGDCPGVLLQTGTVPGWVNSGPSPGPSSPGPDAGRRDTESSSTDYSLSDTEEGSEVLSSSTEYLISSGEEDPDQAHLGTEAPTEEQGRTHLSHPSGPGASSSTRQETSPAIPEVRQLIPEERTSERESGMNIPASLVSPWKPLFLEETLSEILSPVDEVLSYGSTELPPTVTDDLLLPPAPPACEVITWTSEDGFPPPHEEQCEPHLLEDPSIKSDDLPSLSDDPLLPVSIGLSIGLTDRRGNDADFLKVDPVTTGYSAGQRSWEGQGKEDVKSLQSAALSRVEEDENTNSSDLLSSFRIGDRVLVCGSRLGQLRFKGTTSFASGHWAGVALDHPAGNHDGVFRGVRYFQCTKNCGVLVRAEDISRLHSEQESDQETRADDPFSDEEPPSANKPPRDRRAESTGKPSGTGVEKCWSQSQGGERSGGAGDHSSAPQMSRDGFPRELNNNPLQSPTPVCEDTLTAPERSTPRACGGFDPGIHEAQCEEDTQSHQLQQGMFEAEEKESCLIHLDFWNSMSFTGDLRGCGSPNDLGVGRVPWSCLKGPPDMRTETTPLLLLEQSTSQTPLDCLGSPLEKRERGVRPAPCADPQEGRVDPGGRCIRDLDSLVDRLMGKLLMEVVKEAEEVRTKHRGKRSTLKKENHIQNHQALGKGGGGQVKPNLNPNPRSSPPCFSDQWRCSLALAAQPRVRVKPHDPGVVHRLVAASVEALWGQTGGCVANSAEAPAYLSGEDSRRTYRQVIFDLTSDIFHEALRCRWGTSVSPWVLKETSPVSPVWSSKTSLSNVKAVIQAEVRRELNLELTDVQTREMLQNLCKYRTAHRDRVDYVLIQELHKEEQQWVDYSLDQLSVKMQLTEEIFDILLQDTISVLNHIYAVPSSESPPALQPSQSSLIP
ncbi:hypothetical protein SKAU_G00005540 [Synaphobranchus kaupii]|uniref:CAP-Gly domain-containing protein n=1 Tax=Synaphobranchus kaupii TaxID=118154 RepID=A0A9Q1GA74_SYNKA|nr:hypothetical protein SKAU_G00005540 [Synaphobranchus kaupii]